MRIVSALTILTFFDLSEMRLREMRGLVMASAARLACRASRSWRFLRRVSGTSCRSVLGFMMGGSLLQVCDSTSIIRQVFCEVMVKGE